MLKISIDRQVINSNLLRGEFHPPIVIEMDGNPSCIYATTVDITGPSRIVYRPQEPDADDAAATCWIEVEGDVICR